MLSNSDEPAHSVKAAALMEGEFVPPKVPLPDDGPGALLRGGFTTGVHVPKAYTWQTSKIPLCYIYDAKQSAACAPQFHADDRPSMWTTLIGRYPPTYYASVGWVTLLDTGSVGFYSMRLLTAALCAALLAGALAAATTTRRARFMAVGVLLACTPMVFVLAGSINPNAVEAAAGVCAWATLAAALVHDGRQLPRALLFGIGASCALLAVTRPLSTLWLLVIALTVLAALGRWQLLMTRLREPGVRVVVAAVGVAAAAGAVWTVFSDNLDNNSGYEPRGLDLFHVIKHSLAITPAYLRQMVAAFGWQRVEGPWPLAWAWGLVIAVIVVAALRWGGRRLAVSAVGLLVLVVLTPTILQAPTAGDIGFVWSGRYGLAIAAGVPILAALAIGSSGRLSARGMRRLAAGLVGVFAVAQVVAHAASMRRYVVGVRGPLAYFTGPGWRPPVPTLLLLALVIAFASGLSVLVYRVATEGDPVADRVLDDDAPDGRSGDALVAS